MKNEKLVLGFWDLDDEFFCLVFEFFDEIVHDIDIRKTSQLVIWVIFLLLNVVICSGNSPGCQDWEYFGVVVLIFYQAFGRSFENTAA